MTLVTGGELFTGNTALVTAAYAEGEIEGKDLVKNWVSSYLGNFVGSLLLAYLAYKSGTLGAGPAASAIATAKCSLPWDVAFVRGILCNWLVRMAVYMASGCSTMIGKMTAVWFPISAFVALGLDVSGLVLIGSFHASSRSFFSLLFLLCLIYVALCRQHVHYSPWYAPWSRDYCRSNVP